MSARALRITLIVLTLIGLAVASYLTYIHYSGIKPLCGRNGGDCEIVQISEYSKLAGVPVALIGLLGYVAILAALLVPESESSRLAAVILTTVGFGFSVYLTYREVFSLHRICEWCVSSAVIMTALMGLSVWRFLRGDVQPRDARGEPGITPGEPAAPVGASGP